MKGSSRWTGSLETDHAENKEYNPIFLTFWQNEPKVPLLDDGFDDPHQAVGEQQRPRQREPQAKQNDRGRPERATLRLRLKLELRHGDLT